MPRVTFLKGDITKEPVDAIVNAANSTLLGGGGVDGAIHRAAGRSLLEECSRLRQTTYKHGLPTGFAVATAAGALPCKWVIHTVGPVYESSDDPAGELIRAYQNCLKVADEIGAKSVAFCAISAGAYGYPLIENASVAVQAIAKATTKVEDIRFVLFNEHTLDVFAHAWSLVKPPIPTPLGVM